MKRTLILIVLLVMGSMFAIAEPALVGNNDVPVDALSKDDAANIFLGKKKSWDSGTKIILAVLNSGDVHEDFMKNVVKKSPSQFSSFWKKIVFTGKGVMPKSFDSEDALMDFVSKTSGAVGYIDAATAKKSVKAITFQ